MPKQPKQADKNAPDGQSAAEGAQFLGTGPLWDRPEKKHSPRRIDPEPPAAPRRGQGVGQGVGQLGQEQRELRGDTVEGMVVDIRAQLRPDTGVPVVLLSLLWPDPEADQEGHTPQRHATATLSMDDARQIAFGMIEAVATSYAQAQQRTEMNTLMQYFVTLSAANGIPDLGAAMRLMSAYQMFRASVTGRLPEPGLGQTEAQAQAEAPKEEGGA